LQEQDTGPMGQFDICSYAEQGLYGAATGILAEDGTLTGHHMIPDHCLYYTSGLRGKGDLTGFACPGVSGYHIMDAPVIILSADRNGGKSRNHGLAHAIFDPIEVAAAMGGSEWTYADARAAAVKSIATQFKPSADLVTAALDGYFKDKLGIEDDTLLRAGEHGTMSSAPAPRRSSRFSPY
jgi:hypothetical protein